jgi:hypothetical protein
MSSLLSENTNRSFWSIALRADSRVLGKRPINTVGWCEVRALRRATMYPSIISIKTRAIAAEPR